MACALAGSTFAGMALPAAAQTATPMTPSASNATISLAQAVDAAWQRAIQAREAESQTRRARGDQISANSLSAAAPAFEVNHLNDRVHSNAGRRETEVGIAWPLWLPGQRAARLAAADAELRLADFGTDAARLRVAGQVREAAWKLSSAQAELQAVGAQQRYLQGVADDVQRRVAAGDLARADSLAARADLLDEVISTSK